MVRLREHAWRFSVDVVRARTETKRVIRRFLALIVFTVVAVLICAALMYKFERDAPDSDMTTFGLAIFWSASQLLTLGSPLNNPVTTGGRILAVAMDVYAVVVIGTISGTLGAYFLHRIDLRLKESDEKEERDQHPTRHRHERHDQARTPDGSEAPEG